MTLWRRAVDKLRVRHADREAVPVFRILDGDPPRLEVSVRNTRDTVTDARRDLVVSTVALAYWPGEAIALRWLAAAWAGYVQHEALELVTTIDGHRPIDPHADLDLDRGLRHGFPLELTPATLLRTLEAVMPANLAREMIA